MTTDDRWMCARDVAEMLGVSVRTVHTLVSRDGMPAYRIGVQWRFRLSEIDAWTAARRAPCLGVDAHGRPARGGEDRCSAEARSVTALILGLDPSLTAYGWAVVRIDNGLVLNAGCIRTQPAARGKRHAYVGGDDTRRVRVITRELARVVQRHTPRAIAYETNGGAQSARAARALGIACGITGALIECAAELLEIGVIEVPVTAREAKSATGDAGASKSAVVEWASSRAPDQMWGEPVPVREAIADAIAVAEYARQLPHVRGAR